MKKNKYSIRYLQLILATAIILVSSTAQLLFQQYFYHENALYIFFYPFILIVVLLTNSFTIGCFITLTSAVLGLLIHKNDFYYTSNIYYVNGFIFLVYIISGIFFSYSQAHNYKIRSELVSEKKKIDSLVDSVPELIGLWSKDFINIFANKHYHIFYGFAENSIPGLHLSKVIGEELLIKNLETYRNVLSGIEQTVERTINDTSGNTKVVRLNYVPYKVQGSIEGFFVFSNDITEYKKTIAENEVLYKKIIQNEKLVSLGSMAAGISHEINNPIAVIRNYSELALKTIDKENIKNESLVKKLNKIIELTERVSYITAGLLTYARRKQNTTYNSYLLKDIIQESIVLAQNAVTQNDILITTHHDQPDILIECRPLEIQQVLINLLTNALHAVETSPNKWVKIRTNLITPQTLEIHISDSGSGIKPEIAHKIMDPFFTTKDVGKGTGLGLSLSRGLVEDHNGTLVYNSTSVNTEFIITLPLKQKI